MCDVSVFIEFAYLYSNSTALVTNPILLGRVPTKKKDQAFPKELTVQNKGNRGIQADMWDDKEIVRLLVANSASGAHRKLTLNQRFPNFVMLTPGEYVGETV